MNKQFDSTKFYNSFNITIKALAESERITKDALRSLSRECLMLLHYESKNQGDISPVNKIISVVTPMNRKTFILFMQEFSGFRFDEKLGEFSKKDKQLYEEKCKKACNMLDDPHFNLWTWAELHVNVEKKKFKLDTIGRDIVKALSEEDEEGNAVYTKADILKAVIAAKDKEGNSMITMDDFIDFLQAMDVVDVA